MNPSPSNKRGPYRVSIARRRSIVEAAVSVFAESGFSGATMRDVAARVGITPTGLARYFDSKEGLLLAALDHDLERWREYVDSVAGPDRRGLAYVRALPRVAEFFEQHPDIAGFHASMSVEGSVPGHPAHSFVVARQRSTQQSFSRHIAEAVEDGEIPALTEDQVSREAAQLGTMLNGALMRVVLERNLPQEERVYSTAEIFACHVEATIGRWRAALALGA